MRGAAQGACLGAVLRSNPHSITAARIRLFIGIQLGLLVDVNLFRRLRVRGEARGADGFADLLRALSLVTGRPFDKLRPGGWSWQGEGDRLDQHMLCGILDVAHLVATRSLQEGHADVARATAELAARAAPYEEIPRLDVAAVTAAEGHKREAARIVLDDI
jgi:hypothetical protein